MKEGKWGVLGMICCLVLLVLFLVVIPGLANVALSTRETLASDYYSISRPDDFWRHTEYTVYYAGLGEGTQRVWKASGWIWMSYRSYQDFNGDDIVDTIHISNAFGRELDLKRSNHGELFAKEFEEADRVLAETKARFAEKVKEKIKFLEGE